MSLIFTLFTVIGLRSAHFTSQNARKWELIITYQTYSQFDYFGELGTLVQQIANDPLIPKKDNLLIVPSVQVAWTPESVWDTGIVASYSNSIYSLAVERYVPRLEPSS